MRRASTARNALENGNLGRVLLNLKYIKQHGEPKVADKLVEFIATFANKGAQAARVYQGVTKRIGGGTWGIAGSIFAGLKCMGLPRANRLIRATLGVGPAESTVKNQLRNMKTEYKEALCGLDILERLKRAHRYGFVFILLTYNVTLFDVA